MKNYKNLKNIDERNLRLFDPLLYGRRYFVKTDRAPTITLEVRLPFLNHKIFEYLSTTPVISFIEISQEIFGKILRNYIPSKLTNRAKHGFEVPIKEAFR